MIVGKVEYLVKVLYVQRIHQIYFGINLSVVLIIDTTIVGSRPFPCSITGGLRVHRLWLDCDGIFDCV